MFERPTECFWETCERLSIREKLKALGEEATVGANPIDPDRSPAVGSTAIAHSVSVCVHAGSTGRHRRF